MAPYSGTLMSMASTLAASGGEGGWRPTIGDPTVMGWATLAAYLATAVLCWKARAWARDKTEAKFWIVAAAVMLLLGVNKQLDLQTLGGGWVRDWAKDAGWYEDRRKYQALFVAGVAGVGVAAVTLAAWVTFKRWKRLGLACLGLAATCAFVAIRAASFHKVDVMLGKTVGPLKVNVILELGGIVLAGAGALLAWAPWSRPRDRRRR
ncbi:MAG: hypothetical protein AAGA57_09270 [Planctomycetota bacterium]